MPRFRQHAASPRSHMDSKMLDLQRYAFYDAKRTMRLTLEPVSILEMLQDLPGELLFSAPLPAARLGVPCASPDVMHARAAEFAQFDEETAFRLWFNPEPSADGRSVYVSAPDALPEMNGAPDFGIASAGFPSAVRSKCFNGFKVSPVRKPLTNSAQSFQNAFCSLRTAACRNSHGTVEAARN